MSPLSRPCPGRGSGRRARGRRGGSAPRGPSASRRPVRPRAGRPRWRLAAAPVSEMTRGLPKRLPERRATYAARRPLDRVAVKPMTVVPAGRDRDGRVAQPVEVARARPWRPRRTGRRASRTSALSVSVPSARKRTTIAPAPSPPPAAPAPSASGVLVVKERDAARERHGGVPRELRRRRGSRPRRRAGAAAAANRRRSGHHADAVALRVAGERERLRARPRVDRRRGRPGRARARRPTR